MSLLYSTFHKVDKVNPFQSLHFCLLANEGDPLYDVFFREEVQRVGRYFDYYLMVLTNKHLYRISYPGGDFRFEILSEYPIDKIKDITCSSERYCAILLPKQIVVLNAFLNEEWLMEQREPIIIDLSNIKTICCEKNIIYAVSKDNKIYKIKIIETRYDIELLPYTFGQIRQIISNYDKLFVLSSTGLFVVEKDRSHRLEINPRYVDSMIDNENNILSILMRKGYIIDSEKIVTRYNSSKQIANQRYSEWHLDLSPDVREMHDEDRLEYMEGIPDLTLIGYL